MSPVALVTTRYDNPDGSRYPWAQVLVTFAACIPAILLACYLADRWWHPHWGHNDPRELLTLPVLVVPLVPAVVLASVALRLLRTQRSR